MSDILIIVIAGLALVTLVIGCIALFQITTLARTEFLTKELVSQLLRSETDLIKKFGDDQAQGVRQELVLQLKGFQDSMAKAFSTLIEFVGTQSRSFEERLDRGVKEVDEKLDAITNKLNLDIARMGEEASENRDKLRQAVELKLDASGAKAATDSKELRDELNGSFHRLGGSVAETLVQLGEQQKERLETVTSALTILAEKNEKSHEALRTSVESRLDSIRQESAMKLDEMRVMVDEKLQATLETRLGESFTRVVDQLNQMHQGIGEMKTLATSVGDLKYMLTNPKIRGTFGEVQLSLLLEEILTPVQYVRNAQVKENSGERVEFAIKMPGREGHEVLLLVDAKFPIEDYHKLIAATEANDADLVSLSRRQLYVRIRACAKDIRDKYINPPTTTSFAVLFLPTESLYAEVLREVGLLESLQREFNVTLASPTTFGAYLNALQMGFTTLAIEKRSSEVWQVLGAVRAEFAKYNGVVQNLAGQLNRAVNSVDKLGTRTRVMARTLKSVEMTPDEGAVQKLLGLGPDELSLEEIEADGATVEDVALSEIAIEERTAS